MNNVIDKIETLEKILLELQYRNDKCLTLADEFKYHSWEELCDYGIKLLTEIREIR